MLINKYNLKITNFCSKNTYKPEINGIYFSEKESIATDGFSLIKVQIPELSLDDYPILPNEKIVKNPKSFILPIEEAIKISKNLPKKKTKLPILENAVILKQEKDFIEIGSTDLSSVNKTRSYLIEGKYPDYKQVLIKKGKHISITLNVKFLKRIVDFLNEFNLSNVGPENQVKIEIPVNKNQPIFFYGKNKDTGQKCEAVLMPIKEEDNS